MRHFFFTLCALYCLSGTLLSSAAYAQIDLHAHLIMKPGVGPLLQGDFQSPVQTTRWNQRLKTKFTSVTFSEHYQPLNSLLVVSLYAHPVLAQFETTLSNPFHFKHFVRQALETEYQQLKAWVDQHSQQYAIATHPAEAQTLLRQNKTPILLSIEGAYGALDTDESFNLWIKTRGVSIITPFHLTEDEYGGVALLESWKGINSPFEFFSSLWNSKLACLHSFCKSPQGMKEAGKVLVQKLIQNQVWIDLAHANEKTITELIPLLEEHHLPLLTTHTSTRDYFSAERGLGDLEINYIKKHDGIVGLIPTQDMIEKEKINLFSNCQSGLVAFRKEVRDLISKIGLERVALGSDANAPLAGLSPECGSGNSTLLQKGFYDYSQWEDLYTYVSPDSLWPKLNLEHFLKLWAQVRPSPSFSK